MEDVSRWGAWLPHDLKSSDTAVASIFVMSLPGGIAVRFTEYQRSDPGVRACMRRWFEERREKYEFEKQGELTAPTALISLIVQRDEGGDGYALVEARVSNYPGVPEYWPEVPHAELV